MTKPIKIKELEIGSGLPKVCVPLTKMSQEALFEEAKAAGEEKPDLVEWRGDFYEELLVKEKLEETLKGISEILGNIPLLFTVRTVSEGGNANLSAEEYEQVNRNAAESGYADLVDVEVFRVENAGLIGILQKNGVKVIASSHDFEKTDAREILLKRFQEMDATGADILKIAVMPKSFDDVAAIMQVTSEMVHEHTDKPVISMSMGNQGSISRIAGEYFGSAVTFATVGAASAPGQFPIKELRMMMQALHEKNQG